MTFAEEMLAALKSRHSCRSFDTSYKLSEDQFGILLMAIDCGPSAGDIRPYSVWHTSEKEKKDALRLAALDQQFISECSMVFCICADPAKSQEKYGGRGTLYAIQDATIAGMCVTFAASGLGLGTCWVGSIADEAAVRRILKIPGEHMPLSLICIGKQKL